MSDIDMSVGATGLGVVQILPAYSDDLKFGAVGVDEKGRVRMNLPPHMLAEKTLREAVRDVLFGYKDDSLGVSDEPLDAIAALLEATGAPAYIRVAKDLRGEWVEGGRD